MMTRKRRRHTTTRTNLADHDGDAMDGDDDDDSNDGDEDDEEGNVMSRAAIQVDAPELPPPPEPKLQPLGMSELSPFSVTLPAPKDGKDPSRLIIPLSMLVGDSAVLEMHTPISGDALLCWARAWCGVSTGDVGALLTFAESMASTLEDCSKDQAKILQQAQTDPAVRSRLTHRAIQASAASMHTQVRWIRRAIENDTHYSWEPALSSRSSAFIGLRVYDETLLCHSGAENAARRRGSSVFGRHDV